MFKYEPRGNEHDNKVQKKAEQTAFIKVLHKLPIKSGSAKDEDNNM
jgi:hypothetical protein